MKFISYILSCALVVGCASDQLSIQKLKNNDYKITGKLDKDEYDEIIRIVKSAPNQQINFYVDSLGGTSADLFECMDTVYNHGMVHWYSLNHCDSACAVLALSTRHAHGHYRLHSFYKHHHHHIYPAPDFNALVLDRLGHYGYDTNQLNHMFHSVEELWDLTLDNGVIVE